ncbi:uncharacterized protein VTP21DRAFT_9139 [Calcarisporiella thermophila]|uniref:uncharacterized protein n=1 Tax=Calcarisporiella thermophila TaxID=911321 RepID=UPI00374279F6
MHFFLRSLATALVAFPLLSSAQQAVAVQTHSIYPPYIDQELQSRWWDFGGDAVINTMKYVRLTSDQPSQHGWLWSRLPLTSPNFEIEVEFQVTNNHNSHLSGDGFGLFLTTERAETGNAFGFNEKFEGLGIFFDTYQNAHDYKHGYPFVMAMLGDGKTTYDHDQDGSTNALALCEADIQGTENPIKAKLSYYRGEYLEVLLQYAPEEEWIQCFEISNVTLPSMPYLGFSAQTGDVSGNHDILSISTHSIVSPGGHPMVKQHVLKRVHRFTFPRLSWSFFMKLTVLGALVAAAVLYYQRQKDESMKRF